MPGHDAGESGDAEASFVEADEAARAHWKHRGIDQHRKRKIVALTLGPFLLGKTDPALRCILEHGELDRYADLWGGQPDSGSSLHGCSHLVDEPMELTRTKDRGVDQF